MTTHFCVFVFYKSKAVSFVALLSRDTLLFIQSISLRNKIVSNP